MKFRFLPIAFAFLLAFSACKNSNQNTDKAPVTDSIKLVSPYFSADSAYAYTKKQVDFGPRIPGSKAHAACAEWLVAKLKSFGADVQIQSAPVKTFDGKTYTLKNIIARYQPENKNRILVTAHWDARPFFGRRPGPEDERQAF